jgi:hypothetical protein
MDLLTTYTHHSEMYVITALPLISILDKSLQHPLSHLPACCVITSRSLAKASNSGDSSASLAQVLLSQPPVQYSTVNSTIASSLLFHVIGRIKEREDALRRARHELQSALMLAVEFSKMYYTR